MYLKNFHDKTIQEKLDYALESIAEIKREAETNSTFFKQLEKEHDCLDNACRELQYLRIMFADLDVVEKILKRKIYLEPSRHRLAAVKNSKLTPSILNKMPGKFPDKIPARVIHALMDNPSPIIIEFLSGAPNTFLRRNLPNIYKYVYFKRLIKTSLYYNNVEVLDIINTDIDKNHFDLNHPYELIRYNDLKKIIKNARNNTKNTS